ncbi:MAG: RluA family pseudouridine synthase [Oligoflexia bacterium]|nr:RluA family pseudouridine synthase [Oligoflexia bacterium]
MAGTSLNFTLRIEPGAPPARLDGVVLAQARALAPSLSRASLKELFRKGRVRVAGRPLAASDQLPAGLYAITISEVDPRELESREARPSVQGSFLRVAHEDERLLILDKTSGTPSVPHAPEETETAVGAALAHAPGLKGVGRGGLEPGLLHRLDTGTSGLLAFAKSQAEFERLRALWSGGEVRKTYRAVAQAGPSARPLRAPLELRLELAHDPDSAKRMVALAPGRKLRHRGKPLPTLTRIQKIRELSETLLDLEIEIQTGVMHQIRCTLASLGWPILGDPIYRGAPAPRLWLHAWKLELPCEKEEGGTRLLVESPLPKDWPTS